MSLPNYRNASTDQDDSPLLTAMLGVAAVFTLAAVIVLSYYLNTWYGAYLWSY